MRLEQILLEYGKENNLGELKLDADGKSMVLINDTSTVVFEHALGRNGFYGYGAIAKVPLEKEAQITSAALEGNLFGMETGLCQLGYAKEQKLLILFFYIDEDTTNYEQFKHRFQEFTDHLLHWDKKIKEILEMPAGSPALNPNLKQPQDEVKKRIFYA